MSGGEMGSYLENIEEYRRKIDEIDQQLLQLLKQRFDLSEKIGRIKVEHKTDVKDDLRESDLFSRIERFCDDQNLSKEFVINIWRKILTHSYSIQNNVKNGD